MKPVVNIFWFRRDLRLDDNAGLYHALRGGYPLVPLFIFDTDILDQLEDRTDRRVAFIHAALEGLKTELAGLSSTIEVYHGNPYAIFEQLLNQYQLKKVFTNHDYEPYARERDEKIYQLLEQYKVHFYSFKDQVIFEKDEVLKDDGTPYTVFTPYSKRWKLKLNEFYCKSYPTENYFNHFYRQPVRVLPSLSVIGFEPAEKSFPAKHLEKEMLKKYKEQRDLPALPGTSRLSVHLRFGTVSIRKLLAYAGSLSEAFVNELIWRDFYQMILWHFPKIGQS